MLRAMVPRAFTARGLPVTPQLQAWLDEVRRGDDAAELMEVALECRDAADFLRRARGLR